MVAVLKTPAPKASMDEQNRFWLDVVEKYRSTRQGRVAFCKWLGIKPEDLAKWLRRLEPKLAGEKGEVCNQKEIRKSSSFVPVKIAPAPKRFPVRTESLRQAASLVLDFQNGIRLSLSNDFEESALTRILDVMERRSC